jgi:putative copper export protein
MAALIRWLSQTQASETLRAADWIIATLQTVHILAIAMLLSSVLLIGLRVLRAAAPGAPSLPDTARRFAGWIWSGLGLLALTGATLMIAEPKRTLPNATFQLKMLLLVLAALVTLTLLARLRRAPAGLRPLALAALALWCAVAVAGRFIAYTPPD